LKTHRNSQPVTIFGVESKIVVLKHTAKSNV
jgi:hypothetical protein